MNRIGIFLLSFSLFQFTAFSQTFKSWNPATSGFTRLDGQAWPAESEPYTRFPKRAKENVSKDVWDLSRNSTGVAIRFKTNARKFTVRYIVEGEFGFRHMPPTGVSGLDLYGVDRDGKWLWFPGRSTFKDTITYTFSGLLSRNDTTGRNYEYKLYLPLYNTVKWLEVNYPDTVSFEQMQVRNEKPIVVYGTSIAQGGCASRPGMAWPTIMERNIDRPVINLGFSGNGLLDTAVLELMTEIDAKLYVLDCLPNLIEQKKFPDEDVTKRILNSVKMLQTKRPGVPIVLSEHSAAGPNNGRNMDSDNAFEHANMLMRKAFTKMQNDGTKNIYLLTDTEINFSMNSTVDGEHPNDLGMEQNAIACEKLIRKILNEPVGKGITTTAVSQSRDYFYFMPDRHREILEYNKQHKPKTVFIGNSIVHMWGGNPASSIVNGNESWNEIFKPLNTVNLGFGWDRIENVLWRVYHDELEGYDAENIIVMIGTNNIGLNTDEEILTGLENLYSHIRIRQPKAKLHIIGILPRRATEQRILSLNKRIAQIARAAKATYTDAGKKLLTKNGTIDENMFTDGLHPNEAGYWKLGVEINKLIKK